MRANEKILIVDDDPSIRFALTDALRSWEYDPHSAGTVAEATAVLADGHPAVALLDIELPDGSGLEILEQIKTQNVDTIVIMITGNVKLPNVLTALRAGAHDFVGKPVKLEELRLTIRNALETRALRREVQRTRKERASSFRFDQILGDSPAMRNAVDLAFKVADSDVASILLQGETGTGKDLFARAIHYASDRASAPYLAINCAALPATLIESELFGYEKGAFTDAKQTKEGLFEQAQDGTIFLDEIGEMELSLQAKLLRVLEEGRFRRVGGLKDLPLDVRIVAASNLDLKAAGEEGRFRFDLYFRLSIIQVDIPPLRDRGDDVLLLAQHYIEKANLKRRGKKLKGLDKEVARVFRSYRWPGNVRELRNVIERASILEEGPSVTLFHLPHDMLGAGSSGVSGPNGIVLPPDGFSLDEVENELCRQAFERTGGNLSRAARLLRITRDQLRYRLRKTHDTAVKESKASESQ